MQKGRRKGWKPTRDVALSSTYAVYFGIMRWPAAFSIILKLSLSGEFLTLIQICTIVSPQAMPAGCLRISVHEWMRPNTSVSHVTHQSSRLIAGQRFTKPTQLIPLTRTIHIISYAGQINGYTTIVGHAPLQPNSPSPSLPPPRISTLSVKRRVTRMRRWPSHLSTEFSSCQRLTGRRES